MVATLFLIADLILPVAGHVRSTTAEFRTVVWVTNLSARPANVRAAFLEGHPLKSAPGSTTIAVAPNETKQIDDLPALLGRVGALGAIRFESDQPIAVNARIYAEGTGGDGLHAITADDALAKGDQAVLNGITYSGDGNSETTYFVETSGRLVQVLVKLRDESGREVAHKTFLLEGYEPRPMRSGEIAGNMFVKNGTLEVRVIGGSGRLYAIGDQRLRGVNDGYFIEMQPAALHRDSLSSGEVIVYSLTALAVIASALYSLKNRRKRLLS